MEEVIRLTRELGKAIQKNEKYLNYVEARKANDADEELTSLMSKINIIQASYQQEASREDASEDKMRAYDEEFRQVYSQIMMNKTMQNFEAVRKELDDMMNYLTGILALCVNGQDPETCEPAPVGCTGSCSTCESNCSSAE
jgi:cell fate (sporulation/competence/biofilm development) regulator YlbF (YheA/YmcA/DUF963 family)